jgi:hypothetical protein
MNYVGHGGSSRGHRRGECVRGGRSRGGAPSCGDRHDNDSCPECQICGKVGYTTVKCWYRMDESFQDEHPSPALVSTSSYKVDPTDHITSDLDRLTMWVMAWCKSAMRQV